MLLNVTAPFGGTWTTLWLEGPCALGDGAGMDASLPLLHGRTLERPEPGAERR